jgi:neutral trehalase
MSEHLDAEAVEVLKTNDRGGYTVPTARLYPYQWNWDSAFVALGYGAFDRVRAWTELEFLLEGQWDDGMVPSILFRHDDPDYFPGPGVWQTRTARAVAPPMPSTGISQPPIMATAMHELVASGDQYDLDRAASMIDRVVDWHVWFQRDRSTDGVVATVHPWETGRDNCPDWEIGLDAMTVDEALEPYQRKDTQHAQARQRPRQDQYDKFITLVKFARERGWDQRRFTDESPFLMADPGIHFILLRANRDLLRLAEQVGNENAVNNLQQLIAQGERSTDQFWNDDIGAFTARNMKTGEFSGGVSNASFLCFAANAGTDIQRQRTIEHLERIQKQVKFLMPSWDPAAEGFDAQRYWCGPVWPQMNYLISLGLAEQGYNSHAQKVRQDLCQLIQQSGFRECFDPVTGEGCLGKQFSWTAAIWLAWASPNKQELAA